MPRQDGSCYWLPLAYSVIAGAEAATAAEPRPLPEATFRPTLRVPAVQAHRKGPADRHTLRKGRVLSRRGCALLHNLLARKRSKPGDGKLSRSHYYHGA